MTRPMKHQFPPAIVSSTVGATMISIMVSCLVASPIFTPIVVTPDTTKYEHIKPHKPSGHLYRLSPIPAGADWTS